MTNLKSVDMSGNIVGTREGLQGLLNAPILEILDLRGCPICTTDNYRRWVIARGPVTLKLLDGKEVNALERRYAYNLFPELKPVSGVAVNSASGVAASSVISPLKRADDLFGAVDRNTAHIQPASAQVGAAAPIVDIFSSNPSSSSGSNAPSSTNNAMLGQFFPHSTVPGLTRAEEEERAATIAAAAATARLKQEQREKEREENERLEAERRKEGEQIGGKQEGDDDDRSEPKTEKKPAVVVDLVHPSTKDILIDNDVVARKDTDILSDGLTVAKPVKQVKAPPAASVSVIVTSPPVEPSGAGPETSAPATVSSTPLLALEKEVVLSSAIMDAASLASSSNVDPLDNDVLGGNSFFEKRSKDSNTAALLKKRTIPPALDTSSPAGPVDLASMFFEEQKKSSTSSLGAASAQAAKSRNAGLSVLEEQSMYSPLSSGAAAVQFGGARQVRGDPLTPMTTTTTTTKVDTYNALQASETGEAVSYGVEQVMAYVLRGFHPSSSNAAHGLFEFTINHKMETADVFYVRVSSPSGVSVHSGHVPSPEQWAIDCKLTLTEDVMQDVLNGKTEPSSALMNGSLQVEGQLQKLLLFKEVFHFALARFNSFRARWNQIILEEETEMADRARGKVLDDDFADALQFLLFAWKGSYPRSWTAQPVAYVLIALLPDNVYYKGYKTNVLVTPPKVLLRMTPDSLEFVQAASQDHANSDGGSVMCEIWGKKSVLISLFTGQMTVPQCLGLLSAEPAPGAASGSRYVYAHSSWRDMENDPAMWLNRSNSSTARDDHKVPPFLFVRNISHFDGVNDFAELMQCFDVNVLTYHHFTAAKSDQQKEKTKGAKRGQDVSAQLAATSPHSQSSSPGGDLFAALPGGSSAARLRSSSPLEFLEKLKGDISKRLQNARPSSPTSALSRSPGGTGISPPRSRSAGRTHAWNGDDEEMGPGAMGEMKPITKVSSQGVSESRGFTPQIFPGASFDDYEV